MRFVRLEQSTVREYLGIKAGNPLNEGLFEASDAAGMMSMSETQASLAGAPGHRPRPA